jgi:hypothetical protein
MAKVKWLLPAIAAMIVMLPGWDAWAGTDPADKCAAAKVKALGKRASDLLKAHAKNIQNPDSTKFAASLSKAGEKYMNSVSNAEEKGGCNTTGDAEYLPRPFDRWEHWLIPMVTALPACGHPGDLTCDGHCPDPDLNCVLSQQIPNLCVCKPYWWPVLPDMPPVDVIDMPVCKPYRDWICDEPLTDIGTWCGPMGEEAICGSPGGAFLDPHEGVLD